MRNDIYFAILYSMSEESLEPKQSQSVFLVELDKIKLNPHQPRRDFDPIKLQELAASIRSYGVLQPLVVFRQELEVPTGAIVEYELIAGERRLRASKLAGLDHVPVVVRKEPPERIKLEIALVENVQREDLNPMERAEAYKKLLDDFGMTQRMLAERIGKSREAVANLVRLTGLPDFIKQALREGKMMEGHARPLMMLADRPEEQKKLFEETIHKKVSVRYAEQVARRIATDRIRKRDDLITDTEARKIEEKLSEALGTRVFVVRNKNSGGGRIAIDFFSPEDLYGFMKRLGQHETILANTGEMPTGIDSPEATSPEPESSPIDRPEPPSSHATEEDLKNFTI